MVDCTRAYRVQCWAATQHPPAVLCGPSHRWSVDVVCDNGPGILDAALDIWAYHHDITLAFIAPGHPVQGPFASIFNGRLRDKCLNER